MHNVDRWDALAAWLDSASKHELHLVATWRVTPVFPGVRGRALPRATVREYALMHLARLAAREAAGIT